MLKLLFLQHKGTFSLLLRPAETFFLLMQPVSPFFVKMWPSYETEFETPALSKEKLCNRLWNKKCTHKMLMKLTSGWIQYSNLTNYEAFLTWNFFSTQNSFSSSIRFHQNWPWSVSFLALTLKFILLKSWSFQLWILLIFKSRFFILH